MPDPSTIIDRMMLKDRFSQWLGIERIEEGIGFCVLRMSVRDEMCNGFEIAHGGITYSLADSALAFASNSQGRHALSIQTSISHIKPVSIGDLLIARAVEKSISHRLAIYEVTITNQSSEIVAIFQGTVYRKQAEWAR